MKRPPKQSVELAANSAARPVAEHGRGQTNTEHRPSSQTRLDHRRRFAHSYASEGCSLMGSTRPRLTEVREECAAAGRSQGDAEDEDQDEENHHK
jgi:hypothetical protein